MITIKDMSTAELLAARREANGCVGSWDYEQNKPAGPVFIGSRKVPGGTAEYPLYESVHANKAEIEAELKTRPHVPGKAEGKLLRRLMAETGWTEEALRAHPKFGARLVDVQRPLRYRISPAEAKRLEPILGRRRIGNAFKIVKPGN